MTGCVIRSPGMMTDVCRRCSTGLATRRRWPRSYASRLSNRSSGSPATDSFRAEPPPHADAGARSASAQPRSNGATVLPETTTTSPRPHRSRGPASASATKRFRGSAASRAIPSPRKASSVFEQTNKCHHGNAIMNGPALATGFGHSSWHSGSLFRYLPGDRGCLPAGAPSTAATWLRAEKVSCFFAGGGIERGCHLRGRGAGQAALQRGLLPLVGGGGEPRERARHRVGVQAE